MIFVADIQREVAQPWHVPLGAMTAPRSAGGNVRRIAHARQVAMSLSVRLTRHSCTRIGELFGGRDHSTVIYACRTVASRRFHDCEFRDAFSRATRALIGRNEP